MSFYNTHTYIIIIIKRSYIMMPASPLSCPWHQTDVKPYAIFFDLFDT